jgi:hypothetical protein
VSDDGPVGELGYGWSFTQDAGTPGAGFGIEDENPGVMGGYDETVAGEIELAVRDGDGLVTTVTFALVAGQFPDALVVDDTPQPLTTTITPLATGTGLYETEPVLGVDAAGHYVVYTAYEILPGGGFGPGQILCQRLNEDGTLDGSVITVSDGATHDKLADASGSEVAYTAFESSGSQMGNVLVYDLETQSRTVVTPSQVAVWKASIFERAVVWVEGQSLETRIMYYGLDWSGVDPVRIGGTNPPASEVDIGSRYVVWVEHILDPPGVLPGEIVCYGLQWGVEQRVTWSEEVDDGHPATSDSLIIWKETAMDGSMSIELGDYSQDPETRTTVASSDLYLGAPSIDGDYVVYSSRETGDLDLYLYRYTDGQTVPLVSGPGDQYRSSILGNKVAYVDDSSGSADVYVVNFTLAP